MHASSHVPRHAPSASATAPGQAATVPVIPPGSTIGIIGGGQLGRMTALAAAQLGYRTHIYSPFADSPAEQVATRTTVAAYTDRQALDAFAAAVDVVTYEFENIPVSTLEVLAERVPVRPGARLLHISQNRLREKDFISGLGVATTPYAPVRQYADLVASVERIGVPCVLKTAEMGYDGKGQVKLSASSDLRHEWEHLRTEEAILEGFVDFRKEASVIVARNAAGAVSCYPVVENIHEQHVLSITRAPADLAVSLKERATAIATTIATAADLVGLLAVELFITRDNAVLVNELAPRPHNSGHWTMDASMTSQFEQLVRAICGLPLGDTDLRCPAEMLNVLGDDIAHWLKYLAEPNTRVHLYGKGDPSPGRKMGHVTRLLK